MKLSFLHDLTLSEALEIDPLEIEAFIKENNLEDIASVQNGILHIWRYRIPLTYKKGGVLPPKHLYALSKFFSLIDSMSSKYYDGLFDITSEEAQALKNLVLKAIMPNDDARALATSLNQKYERRRKKKKLPIKSVYNTYKKIDTDTDIMQLPLNLALLLSAAMDLRSSRYDPMERFRWEEGGEESAAAQEVKAKLKELKELSSHTGRLEMFKTAAWHALSRDSYYSRKRDNNAIIQQLDKRALKTFIKLEEIPKASWYLLGSIEEAIMAITKIKGLKPIQHMSTIPFNFWSGIKDLEGDLRHRAGGGYDYPHYDRVLNWWAANPTAEKNIIVDTIAMAKQYEQPVRFWNRDVAALHAEHDELTELSKAEEKKQVFNNDIMPLKVHDNLQLEHLNNTYDLKYEGKSMNHCVGSYSDSCMNGTSVIYRIHWDGKHIGTLELASNDYDRVTLDNATIRQAMGRFNRKLSDDVHDAIRGLIALNRKHAKEQTQAPKALEYKPDQPDDVDFAVGLNRPDAPEQEQEEPDPDLPPEYEQYCYECGSPRVDEIYGGMRCRDCGNYEQDPEYQDPRAGAGW